MLKTFQHTILKPVRFTGIGLHSGNKVRMNVLPGMEDQGILFKRIDLKKNNLIKADFQNVSSAKLCTTLKNESGIKVSTVEHLLAALYISDIDNAIIEIDNEEVPIMDGSAKVFTENFEKTGIKKLAKKRKYLKILKKIELKDGRRKISIEPIENSSFEVDFQLNYENKIIGTQRNSINFQSDDLETVIQARTFCLFKDIEKIKKLGLAKGGSLDNAIVVDDHKIINKSGLRCEKEFVNHKILDLAGDFLLSGSRVLGKVICQQGGHELTNTFIKKLKSSNSTSAIIEVENIMIAKKTSSTSSVKIAVNA